MVVSDSSPLMNLAIISRLDLLYDLYESINIPEAVWKELVEHGKGKPGSKAIESASWIQTHQVQNRHLITSLQERLDSGESEAIVLALELKAELLLIDETEGRRVAATYGINKTGVLGILLLAKQKGLIPSLKRELDLLQQKAHFWISTPLYRKLLDAAKD